MVGRGVTDWLFGFVGFYGKRADRAITCAAGRPELVRTAPSRRQPSTWLGRRIAGHGLGQYRIRSPLAANNAPTPTWAADLAVGLRLPPAHDNRRTQARAPLAWQG